MPTPGIATGTKYGSQFTVVLIAGSIAGSSLTSSEVVDFDAQSMKRSNPRIERTFTSHDTEVELFGSLQARVERWDRYIQELANTGFARAEGVRALASCVSPILGGDFPFAMTTEDGEVAMSWNVDGIGSVDASLAPDGHVEWFVFHGCEAIDGGEFGFDALDAEIRSLTQAIAQLRSRPATCV